LAPASDADFARTVDERYCAKKVIDTVTVINVPRGCEHMTQKLLQRSVTRNALNIAARRNRTDTRLPATAAPRLVAQVVQPVRDF